MANNSSKKYTWILLLALALASQPSFANEEHTHGTEEGEGEEESATISDAAIKNMDIEIAQASSEMVRQTISVSGRVTLNQNATAQVRARFPGIIRSVTKEPGETVKEGDVLATVESNDSLQVYPVKAPIDGVVISRNANIGEMAAAGDVPLFVVANLNQLWAELFVFSKDGEQIKAGQKVNIQCLDDDVNAESVLTLVLPTAEASSQTLIARAVIDNNSGHWRSGMNIRADVVLAEQQVPLAVKTEAIQRDEGKMVVFVRENEQDGKATYKPRPIETGISDHEWTQVTGGLKAGEPYVAKNSFIVKADIAKSGAEHEH